MGSADLHVHPLDSDGRPVLDLPRLVRLMEHRRLDAVVLAEHDRIDVSVALAAEAAEAGVEGVIVGEEITTRDGHLVGILLTDPVPPGLSLAESIAAIHEQGGLAVIAHPMLFGPTCASARAIRAAAAAPGGRPDAIEVFNRASASLPWQRGRITRIASELELARVGGSDAHGPDAVGLARTSYPGTTVPDLCAAIVARRTDGDGRAMPLAHTLAIPVGKAARLVRRRLVPAT